MRVFVAFTLTFLQLFQQISAVRIYCEYNYVAWTILGNSYTCQVKNLNVTQPNDSIVKVFGNHLQRLNQNDVRALEIHSQNSHFLPQRIKNFFPNLELLRVSNSRLKIISQADLKPLSKLRVIQMYNNDVTVLDNDLFDSNLELIRIDFKHQKLKLIGYNIFDKLDRLALANFEFSGCVNFFAKNGRAGIEELKKEIRINCQIPVSDFIDEIKKLKDKVESLESLNQNSKLVNLDLTNDAAFVKIYAKFSKLQSDNEKCLAKSNILAKNFFSVVEKIENVEKALVGKESCALKDVENKKCLLEKENLMRFKRESNFIDIECQKVEWTKSDESLQSCNVKNIKILNSEVEIKNVVMGHQLQEIDGGNIEELKAFNEQIIFLPLNLAEKFSKLKSMSFIDCGLISVNTKALNSLIHLQTLSFSHNQIKQISPDSLNIQALTILDFSHNQIEKISEETFKSLHEILVLKINDNLLTELTANLFSNQQKLKFLFLQNNKLFKVSPIILEPLKKLEFADFSENDCVNTAASKETKITLKNLKTYFAENCSI